MKHSRRYLLSLKQINKSFSIREALTLLLENKEKNKNIKASFFLFDGTKQKKTKVLNIKQKIIFKYPLETKKKL